MAIRQDPVHLEKNEICEQPNDVQVGREVLEPEGVRGEPTLPTRDAGYLATVDITKAWIAFGVRMDFLRVFKKLGFKVSMRTEL